MARKQLGAAPANSPDAVTKSYVDTLLTVGGGMLAPCRAATTGSETYTISAGSVTQIAGTTVDGVSPAVGDDILIATAPAATGAGSAFTLTTQPTNGVYTVTNNTTNLSVSRRADMSGSIQPAGLAVTVESGTSFANSIWQVSNPATDTTAFTWGTTNLAWLNLLGGLATVQASTFLSTFAVQIQQTSGSFFRQSLKANSSASAAVDVFLPATGGSADTLVGRATTDDLTNKRESLAAGSTSVAPLKFASGTNLTTAAAGAVEFDGVTFAGTIDTTSGRGLSPVEQVFRLTADGSAIGGTIADYFGSNSAFPHVAAGVYEIEWVLYFLKTTAGTLTYTITSTQAPVLLSAWYQQTVIGGVGTVGATQQAAVLKSTSTAQALPVTGTLVTGVDHQAVVKALYVAHATNAGNVRLRVTAGAGTITPRAGSYYKVRRIPAGNVGTFVA